VHKRKWEFKSTLRTAYRQVGAHEAAGQPGEVGKTRRVNEVLTAHAALAGLALKSSFEQRFKPSVSCVVDLSCDATPRLVSFGALAAVVAGHARYFVREPDGIKWKVVRLEDFKLLRPRCQPKFGVLELLALRCNVRWLESSGRRDDILYVPPCFLGSAAASTCMAAWRTLVPQFTRDIDALCSKLDLMILHETLDSCAPNLRLVAARARTLPRNCLYCWVPCCAHISHLIACGKPCGEEAVAGDVYAFEFVGRIPAHHTAMVANVRKHLSEELEIVDDGRAPRADHARHLQNLLEFTVRRHIRHVRGRLSSSVDPDSAVFDAAGETHIDEACQKLALVFNGDIRLAKPIHIVTEHTRGLSREEVIDAAVDALVHARLIPGLPSCAN
jgi:hypothetical protein